MNRSSLLFTRFVFAVLVLLMAGAPASAYNLPTCNGGPEIWNRDNVTFWIDTDSFPFSTSQREALLVGRDAWNAAPGTNFRFNTFDFDMNNNYSSGDGYNDILFNSSYNWGTGELAVAIRRHEICFLWSDGLITEVDVLFNPAVSWGFDTQPDPDDNATHLALVAVHEFGHAFGLGHEDRRLASMNSFYPGGGVVGNGNLVQAHADDLAGNRAAYGTPVHVRDLASSAYRRSAAGRASEIVPPPFVFANSPVSFPFTIENRGTVHESSVRVNFYLSTNRWISTLDRQIGSAVFSLGAGAVITPTVTLSVPTSVPAGDYFFGWQVDGSQAITEADESNNYVGYTQPFTLSNLAAPDACFSVVNPTGPPPISVPFSANCSSDSDGTITNYTWNMGDGTTRSGRNITHTYTRSGFFHITLTVRDNDGLTDTTTRTIEVDDEDGPCGSDPICQ